MSSRRFHGSVAVLTAMVGFAVWFLLPSADPGDLQDESGQSARGQQSDTGPTLSTRRTREESALASSGGDAVSHGSASPHSERPHLSDLARWASEGHPVSPEHFRDATFAELGRIESAAGWLDRLEEAAEEPEPACPGCVPVLEPQALQGARAAIDLYQTQLVELTEGGDFGGEDSIAGYRLAREDLLRSLPLPALAWLGSSGFLDAQRDPHQLSPRLHARLTESVDDGQPNTSDDPNWRGI